VASKITPEAQPPNDMPSTEAKMTMPTRVAASAAGIASRLTMPKPIISDSISAPRATIGLPGPISISV
jgi:hypothetical protein